MKKAPPKKAERIEGKIDQILAIVKGHDLKFEAIDQRFVGIDNRLDAMDQRFDAIETRFEHRFDLIEAHFEHYVRKEDFEAFQEKVYLFQDFVVKKLDLLTQESASTHLALKRHDERFEKLEAFVGMPK